MKIPGLKRLIEKINVSGRKGAQIRYGKRFLSPGTRSILKALISSALRSENFSHLRAQRCAFDFPLFVHYLW
ncbi:MAG: hypothetical protein JXA71_02625, partial [Chitinispirillaceae bacterium]|nr:hypothetical protein [Chitinispirillaceae bacterium]